MTCNSIAASCTVLACTPTTSRVLLAIGATPLFGTSANVGLMLTSDCAAAGFWMDPPVSSARPMTAKLAATAVAVPVGTARSRRHFGVHGRARPTGICPGIVPRESRHVGLAEDYGTGGA